MKVVQKKRKESDGDIVELLANVILDDMSHGEILDNELPLNNALCYIAGYCAKSAVRHHKCSDCTSKLINQDLHSTLPQVKTKIITFISIVINIFCKCFKELTKL